MLGPLRVLRIVIEVRDVVHGLELLEVTRRRVATLESVMPLRLCIRLADLALAAEDQTINLLGGGRELRKLQAF